MVKREYNCGYHTVGYRGKEWLKKKEKQGRERGKEGRRKRDVLSNSKGEIHSLCICILNHYAVPSKYPTVLPILL